MRAKKPLIKLLSKKNKKTPVVASPVATSPIENPHQENSPITK